MTHDADTLETCATTLTTLADRLTEDPAVPPWLQTAIRAYATRCRIAAADLTAAESPGDLNGAQEEGR
ncbi:hypothetical protein Acor_04000 [Acrocarpospora corrugata]|uniref:Uncharacterized protein n=1 Tax=Acrocarpospora corrugata TaxID=35763 RepID=A0A5M3VQ49_9ACTN|nr:hypothetical protein [Acrocarpospora corrugata]GER98338.1 hypothetical protein Acor_04000 [Acrocarpospora corrugata]